MSGMRCNVAVAEQRSFVDIRIELRLGCGIADVARPAHEVRHGPRRPIAIEHLDVQSAQTQLTRHVRQRGCRLPRQQAARRLVTVDRPAGEIMHACITDILLQAGHDRSCIDEIAGIVLSVRLAAAPQCGSDQNMAKGFRLNANRHSLQR